MANAMGDDDEDAPPTVDLYAALGASWTPSPIRHPSPPPRVSRWAPRPRRAISTGGARRLARGS